MSMEVNTNSSETQAVSQETPRTQSIRDELVERITRVITANGQLEPLPGLTFHRSSQSGEPLHSVSYPSLCVIAQGSKEVHLGERRVQYDPYHYLLVTAELPLVGQVLKASRERPYLSLILRLDAAVVSSVMIEAGHAAPQRHSDVPAIDVSPIDARLLDAVVRLVRLLDTPDDASVLAPLIHREIVYRLLKGEQGDRMRHIAVVNGESHCITKALDQLHQHFDQSIRIESLAEEVGMSVSSFHQHFKAVTEMTPLQFQKQLRLQEARRLMLAENLDASSAGYHVGYNDASHFSREYKRLFGSPPMRDVERLRESAMHS
jgi:AraC-like DNA-binding protein